MKNHTLVGILILAIVTLVPAMAYANFATRATSSFGGRVVTPNLSIATCIGFGTGPVVLVSNLENLASAAGSASGISGQSSTVSRIGGTISGIYGAIPFYAQKTILSSNNSGGVFNTINFVGATPKTGDWILGRASIIPNFSTCTINGTEGIPFPVRPTNNYQISNTLPINRL